MKYLNYMIICYFMLSLLLLNLDCTDKPDPEPEPQLPPITQEGKNTFGCLVNGKVWLPDVSDGWMDYTLMANFTDSSLYIRAQLIKNPKKEKISISVLQGFTGIGVYKINNKKQGIAYFWNLINHCDFKTDSINNGLVEILYFDIQNHIISGKFSFKASSPICDTIKVTDGRFDIKF